LRSVEQGNRLLGDTLGVLRQVQIADRLEAAADMLPAGGLGIAAALDLAREIAKRSDRKKLVFAPTKYLDQDYLERLKIEFCQLPFEIYQKAQK